MTFLERIGRVFIRLFEETGLWFRMLARTFVWTFRPPFEGGEWLRQMVRVGVDSVPVVFLTTMFTGMVMALQITKTVALIRQVPLRMADVQFLSLKK